MSFIGSVNVPFEKFDTDSQIVDATGNSADQIFTNVGGGGGNLAITRQREILLRNDGTTNVLVGKSLAAARYPILPGDALKLAAVELKNIFLKSVSGSNTVVIIQIP